ncbi:MAG: alpha/beta fold hydrolase, partial [Hyphomicrobiales bacterium]|nr:alpha/beta fold hydrolase [Hyphomicrobiales bacterium]
MAQIRANGIDIEYESVGREDDPAILLIMGLAASLIFWPDSLCQGLAAKGFRVVRFDNRDIGKSTHLAALGWPDLGAMMAERKKGTRSVPPYTLDDMAADAAGLIAALGVERAHIVGASMGGMIAQLVAINHPERTKSLVSIMSTAARPGLPEAKPEAMAAI